jgi:signal transduction histidine kinase
VLDDPSTARSPRIARLLLASTLVVAIGTAALSVHLVSGAVEERVQAEIAQTANLLGGSGFPLADASLVRVAGFVGAEVVAIDADRHVVAASLPEDGRADFEAALRLDALPAPSPDGKVKVVPVTIGPFRYTVGVAATPAGRRALRPGQAGAVYVLYDANLLAGASRRAWLPVSVMAALATVLAALLGVAGERRVLSARNGALLRLLAAVAHEVRNPLGAIRAIARTQARAAARRDAVDPSKLELIAAETERLALLVDGLKNVGRPVQTVRAPISLDGAVRATLDLVGHLLSHRRVVLDVDLGAAGAVGLADATQVRQVVLNLITNAADAQPKGGAIHVTTRALRTAEGATWQLVVEDEGPGVPGALLGRLFEPFFSTRAKGLGVGLYLSRRLARAHGGDLALAPQDPTAPRGARFELTLPWSPELTDSAPAPVALPRPSGRPGVPGDGHA